MEFLPRLSAESSAAVFLSSAVIILLLGGLVCGFTSHRAHPPFPPGPRGIPILGNVRDIPLQRESQTYYQWAKEYGPIVSVHILGQRIVLLNTSDLSRELFESRASLYSHRPSAPMLNMWDYNCLSLLTAKHTLVLIRMGYAQWLVGLLNPGDQWKMCRRLLTQSFNPQTIPRWRPYQQQEVHRLLAKLLDDPENFCRHINR
jgi:cytochrome P450